MLRWLPSLMLMALAGWMIYQADRGIPNVFIRFADQYVYGDKIGHAMLYGGLALLVTVATRFRQWRIGGQRLFVGVVLVLIAALLEEGSQYFLSTRNFDLWDAFADVVGVALAQLFCALWLGTGNRYRQMRRRVR
ncbi:VanZ family protein [Rheinheimera sp. 4Y26]|uniref:VanZ family protein n=1 Tax=Rheinheimera sp. 4Y26 TaxID=2977811 RepID=UPI0021B13291|nr:VanZ family protein [Rheinheimera sp. 4Y26]MCT6700436.1 VanZ family protein [Rheinheimera sp. 4Y26]